MSKAEFGAVIIAVWTLSIWALSMTATSQSRGNKAFLERICWRWARVRAETRRTKLERDVRESDLATLPDDRTLDYLQREDVLYQASKKALAVKMVVPVASSVSAGGALAALVMQRTSWHVWRDVLAIATLLAPMATTFVISWLVGHQGKQRWTTEIVAATARRAYLALLNPPDVSGREPSSEAPFNSPQVTAVRALEEFAIALEKYAMQRALPDGRNPMPQVVAQYSSAAALVRELRDDVELDRIDGAKRALLEVERILKVLASGRMQDLAPNNVAAGDLLRSHHERKAWRGQMLRGLAFTLCLAGIVFALASSAVGIALATAAAAGLVAAWDKILRISVDPDGNRPANG
ncbi:MULTISPECIES: hypothetical protein [Streptomyces violaceusniger group]|uniref:Uncharacterized protein n=2 Tax=Streptomyces violaceusniger group TaxID=2839105 RepID=A0ABD5JA45_9ACTN|nr:hypothetical protein [Streptomyces violaceusniger]MEE4585270.1 hypothetical protein [Streptomyces sp. DSM 41602]